MKTFVTCILIWSFVQRRGNNPEETDEDEFEENLGHPNGNAETRKACEDDQIIAFRKQDKNIGNCWC